jgi:hypothetical protein
MLIRLLNTVILIAAVIGGVLAYRAAKERQQLLAERRRLEKKVGSLPVDDPAKVHVRALETGEELHFAWRVYLPAAPNLRWKCSSGGSSCYSCYSSSGATDFIARVRVRENEQGRFDVFTKQPSGSGRMGLGDEQLADLLRDRWKEVRVEQLGVDGVAVIDANEVSTLLRLTLSDDLKREADQKLKKHFAKRFQTALFDVRFGSDQAFKQAGAGTVGGQ